jgi:hypothetical protein
VVKTSHLAADALTYKYRFIMTAQRFDQAVFAQTVKAPAHHLSLGRELIYSPRCRSWDRIEHSFTSPMGFRVLGLGLRGKCYESTEREVERFAKLPLPGMDTFAAGPPAVTALPVDWFGPPPSTQPTRRRPRAAWPPCLTHP